MPAFRSAPSESVPSDSRMAWMAIIGYTTLGLFIFIAAQFVLNRLGIEVLAYLLAAILAVVVYAVISFRNLSIPFFIVLMSVGGFKFILTVKTPFLPDLYFDRLMLVWLILVFTIKLVAEGRSLRGPFVLDGLIASHFVYTIVQVIQNDMQFFNVWTSSIFIPYSVYFLAKNIVTSKQLVRALFWFLLSLSIYYNITSVAEKFQINWLIWPKYIITQATTAFVGRSQGPFMQAPLFGTVIGMLLPLHLYFIATVKNNLGRLMLGLSLGVGFAGLYFT